MGMVMIITPRLEFTDPSFRRLFAPESILWYFTKVRKGRESLQEEAV